MLPTQELFKYSSRHLMRVYPGGLRIDSSNYNPAEAWTLGASLAALNWQKWDKPLWINEAMVRVLNCLLGACVSQCIGARAITICAVSFIGEHLLQCCMCVFCHSCACEPTATNGALLNCVGVILDLYTVCWQRWMRVRAQACMDAACLQRNGPQPSASTHTWHSARACVWRFL